MVRPSSDFQGEETPLEAGREVSMSEVRGSGSSICCTPQASHHLSFQLNQGLVTPVYLKSSLEEGRWSLHVTTRLWHPARWVSCQVELGSLWLMFSLRPFFSLKDPSKCKYWPLLLRCARWNISLRCPALPMAEDGLVVLAFLSKNFTWSLMREKAYVLGGLAGTAVLFFPHPSREGLETLILISLHRLPEKFWIGISHRQ